MVEEMFVTMDVSVENVSSDEPAVVDGGAVVASPISIVDGLLDALADAASSPIEAVVAPLAQDEGFVAMRVSPEAVQALSTSEAQSARQAIAPPETVRDAPEGWAALMAYILIAHHSGGALVIRSTY